MLRTKLTVTKELQKGVAAMNNTTSSIITIGREYGSAGRQIGQEVARYFGIKCYDKELLEHAANDSGICKELRSLPTAFCILL